MTAFILKTNTIQYISIFSKLSKISIILLKELNMDIQQNDYETTSSLWTRLLINRRARPWKQQERYTNTSSAHSKLTPSSQPTNLHRTPHRFNDLIKKSNITWITFQRRDNRTVWVDTIEDTIFNLKTEFWDLKSL